MNTHDNGTPMVGAPGSPARMTSELEDELLGVEERIKRICSVLPGTKPGSPLRITARNELLDLIAWSADLVRRIDRMKE